MIGNAYNDGQSIKELAKEFDVQTQTIVNHLTRFTNAGNRIRLDEPNKMLAVDESVQTKVFNEFDENGTLSL